VATLGWLKIGVTTDTSQFAKGLKGAANQLDSFKSTVMGIAATMGVAFGAREIIHWVKGAGDAVATAKVLGERVGMTTQSFQKLEYAAKLSHVDGETLTHSLEKMNEKLGDVAVTGEGPAADALRRFGLSAKQLAMSGTEQSFFTLVDVLGKIQNPAERASVAVDLFGKSGAAMINMATQGKGQLQAMGAEAVRLGVALSDVDAAQVVEADVSMIKIGESITGVANAIAITLAPFVTAIADQFTAWMMSGTKTTSYLAQGVDWVTSAIGGLADVGQVAMTAFYGLRSVFDDVFGLALQGIDKLIQGFGWLFEKITGTKLELTTFFADWGELMHKAGDADAAKGMQLMGQKWAHETVRTFVDDLQASAQQRATFNAQKSAGFATAGALEHPKVVETKFAGATEMGSKEAYSAVLKSRSMQQNGMNNRIETNTRTTAEATTRTAIGIARLGDLMQGKQGGNDLGKAMTAGN
jgi:hypothetical protein